MEVHLTPDLEKKLHELASQTGRNADELAQDAIAGFVDAVGEVRGMLNSRYDPATSYEFAAGAARKTGATLLTYDGWGHGAYWAGSSCVTGATDTYLLTTKLPPAGTHCAPVLPQR